MTGAENKPGVLSLYGTSGGLDNNQDFYIMYQSEYTTVIYYCGDTLTWHFEGFLVLTNTDGIYEADQAAVANVLASLDIDPKSLCLLDPETQCPSQSIFLQ